MNNHYETLGIDKSAQTAEIKKAYFDLAKKYHPDSGDETEVKKFYEITEAYKVLTDQDLKKSYDATLKEGLEKISAVQAETTQKKPAEPQSNVQKRDTFRDEELKAFHRNRFRKAVLRVIGFSMVFGLLGMLAAFILGGRWYVGGLSAVLIGFSISIRENFDISTFFESGKKQKLFHFFLWLILFLGVLYFVIITLI